MSDGRASCPTGPGPRVTTPALPLTIHPTGDRACVSGIRFAAAGLYGFISKQGPSVVRLPSQPFFKSYELIAIAIFIIAAAAIGSLGLVY